MTISIEQKISSLGLKLPEIGAPVGNFVPWVRTGNLLFISGQLPVDPGGTPISGTVGEDVTNEEAYQYARLAGLSLLAVARAALGSLDRISRVAKLNGYVNAVAGFTNQPAVINGCSDLFVELWGDRGKHARAAVGVSGLPAGAPVEIEAVFEVAG